MIGRVFRILFVVIVRKRYDEISVLYLFDFIRGDELINDILCVIGKVIELSFLYDEGVGG